MIGVSDAGLVVSDIEMVISVSFFFAMSEKVHTFASSNRRRYGRETPILSARQGKSESGLRELRPLSFFFNILILGQ